MAGRVEGKVAFITGAARGQGRCDAVRLAEEGADIIAVDICAPLPNIPYEHATPEDLQETVRQVEATGRKIIASEVDVRDLEGLKSAADAGVRELGRLDIVVANAGVVSPAPWNEITPDQFKNTLDINVTGVWNTVMATADHVIASGGGSIIVISSSAGLKIQPFLLHYSTSKFAVRGMTKAFAAELGKHNIRVNSIHPTGVDTHMASDAVRDRIGVALQDNADLGGMFGKMLTDRQTDPIDIANAVLYLASDESRFVTAHALAVDMGTTQY